LPGGGTRLAESRRDGEPVRPGEGDVRRGSDPSSDSDRGGGHPRWDCLRRHQGSDSGGRRGHRLALNSLVPAWGAGGGRKTVADLVASVPTAELNPVRSGPSPSIHETLPIVPPPAKRSGAPAGGECQAGAGSRVLASRLAARRRGGSAGRCPLE